MLNEQEVAGLRSATDALVERSRLVENHNEIYDLEPGHNAAEPRVRRIKTPDKWDTRFAAIVRHPGIVACLKALWGPNIRFDSAKLNMKAAGFGASVEWHQDWAFYPHTNDDLAAVGVMIDDMLEENGPLMVIPGSHAGPVYDHHADGRFCGAIDSTRTDLDFSERDAMPRQSRVDQYSPRSRDPCLGPEHIEPLAALVPASVPRCGCLAARQPARNLGIRGPP